jgi:hypothetical protein
MVARGKLMYVITWRVSMVMPPPVILGQGRCIGVT